MLTTECTENTEENQKLAHDCGCPTQSCANYYVFSLLPSLCTQCPLW